jgi:hypothetical protein
MASKRKVKKKLSRKTPRKDDIAIRAQFMGDLLAGELGNVVALHESRNAQGELELEVETEEDA